MERKSSTEDDASAAPSKKKRKLGTKQKKLLQREKKLAAVWTQRKRDAQKILKVLPPVLASMKNALLVRLQPVNSDKVPQYLVSAGHESMTFMTQAEEIWVRVRNGEKPEIVKPLEAKSIFDKVKEYDTLNKNLNAIIDVAKESEEPLQKEAKDKAGKKK